MTPSLFPFSSSLPAFQIFDCLSPFPSCGTNADAKKILKTLLAQQSQQLLLLLYKVSEDSFAATKGGWGISSLVSFESPLLQSNFPERSQKEEEREGGGVAEN